MIANALPEKRTLPPYSKTENPREVEKRNSHRKLEPQHQGGKPGGKPKTKTPNP
jgi:hypothetical protein